MTGSLRIKNDRYYAVISYQDGMKYKQKWISLKLDAKNNKRKAEAALADVLREYEESYGMPSGDMPFIAYVEKWLERKEKTVEKSTWEGYAIYARKHIIPYFSQMHLSIRDIKPKHIADYYTFKLSEGRADGKPGGLSVQAVRKHGIVLRSVLRDAVVEEMIPRNPADGVRIPSKDKHTHDRVFLTNEEANRLIAAFNGHPLQPLVCTTLYYGLRRSEVLGLKWGAVDFDKGTITIQHTVVKNLTTVRKDVTKTDSSRHTYILIDAVRDILLKQKEKRDANASLFGSSYYNDSDYIFTWEDGTLFRPDYITRSFQRVLKRNGLKMMRFHDLRHSTASVLYDRGWSMKDIQLWLRHSSIEVTADIYTHISESRKQSMANDINGIFTNPDKFVENL